LVLFGEVVSFKRDCSAFANFLMNPLDALFQEDGWLPKHHQLLVSLFRYPLSKTAKVPPSVRKNFSQMIAFLISSQESVL